MPLRPLAARGTHARAPGTRCTCTCSRRSICATPSDAPPRRDHRGGPRRRGAAPRRGGHLGGDPHRAGAQCRGRARGSADGGGGRRRRDRPGGRARGGRHRPARPRRAPHAAAAHLAGRRRAAGLPRRGRRHGAGGGALQPARRLARRLPARGGLAADLGRPFAVCHVARAEALPYLPPAAIDLESRRAAGERTSRNGSRERPPRRLDAALVGSTVDRALEWAAARRRRSSSRVRATSRCRAHRRGSTGTALAATAATPVVVAPA